MESSAMTETRLTMMDAPTRAKPLCAATARLRSRRHATTGILTVKMDAVPYAERRTDTTVSERHMPVCGTSMATSPRPFPRLTRILLHQLQSRHQHQCQLQYLYLLILRAETAY